MLCVVKLLSIYDNPNRGFKVCEMVKGWFTVASLSSEFTWPSGNMNPGFLSPGWTFYLLALRLTSPGIFTLAWEGIFTTKVS